MIPAKSARYLIAGAATAAAAWISARSPFVDRRLPLPPALSGERKEIASRAGRLSYYVEGDGPPLLLIHSINAAASAFEVAPVYERLTDRYRVYAPDLPGFGFSDRADRRYDVPLYVAAVDAMLEVIETEHGAVPIDALAVSLSAEFLARVAGGRPERFKTLTFVTPTGFAPSYRGLKGRPGETREVRGLHAAVSLGLWGQGLYDLLVSRRSVRYFLERTWGSKAIDEGLLAYDYLSAHQPGAKHAPFAFLSGRLFSKDIRDVYAALEMPIWMPHGTRGDFGNFSEADWVRRRPNWRELSFATGAMPHFEQPTEFMAAYEGFLSLSAESAASASLSRSRSPSP